VRRPDFGSMVAREELVGIVGQCLCPSRKTSNCNERRRRRAENGTTGSAPLRGGRYLLLGFRPSLSDVDGRLGEAELCKITLRFRRGPFAFNHQPKDRKCAGLTSSEKLLLLTYEIGSAISLFGTERTCRPY
jgi:hypothetical protein